MSSELSAPSLGALFKNRRFAVFATAKFISGLGTWAYRTALVFLVSQVSSSTAIFGVVTATLFLPSVVMPFAGRLSDRLRASRVISRRGWVLVTQTLFGLESVLLAVLVWRDAVTPVWLVVLGLFGGLVYAFNQPVEQSLIVDYAPAGFELQVMAASGVWHRSAQIIGALSAGVLIAWFGFFAVFAGNALSYVIIIVVLVFVAPRVDGFAAQVPEKGETGGDTESGEVQPVAHSGGWWETLKTYAWGDEALRTTYILGVVYAAGLGSFYALAVVPMNMLSDDSPVVYSAVGVGVAVGGLLMSKWVGRQTPRNETYAKFLTFGGVISVLVGVASWVLVSVGVTGMGEVSVWLVAVGGGVAVGAATLVCSAMGNAFILKYSPPDYKTQLMGLYLGVFYAVGGVGVTLAGLMSSTGFWPAIIIVPGLVATVGGFVVYRSERSRGRSTLI